PRIAMPTAVRASSTMTPSHSSLAFLRTARPKADTSTTAIRKRMEKRRIVPPGIHLVCVGVSCRHMVWGACRSDCPSQQLSRRRAAPPGSSVIKHGMSEFSVDHCSSPTEELADLFRTLDLVGPLQRSLARSIHKEHRRTVLEKLRDDLDKLIGCF